MPLPVNASVIDPHYNPATGQDDPNYNGGPSSINYGSQPGYATSITPAGSSTPYGQSPVPDPYAAWGGKGAYDSLVSGFGTQKSNITSTSNEAAQNAAKGLHGSILDFLDSLRSGQGRIDESGVQNELAKKQGYNGVLDMVSHGLQSGGVLLSNKNASSSSAVDALARAYGDIGRRENNNVNNQYELQNHNIGLQQEDLNLQRSQGIRHLNEGQEQSVNGIVLDARNRLAALDASIASANLPQRIDIENEKRAIHDQVAGILGQYNSELNSGAAAINPSSTDARRATAAGLSTAGVSATSPFDFTSATPAQFQGSAPTSDLPLYTTPRKKTG